jgi:hypothetical protein
MHCTYTGNVSSNGTGWQACVRHVCNVELHSYGGAGQVSCKLYNLWNDWKDSTAVLYVFHV